MTLARAAPADLELLLARLDTGPDLIDYLASRAEAVRPRPGVTFGEPELLALAINSWMNGEGHTVSPSPIEILELDGAWERYEGSERAASLRARAWRPTGVGRTGRAHCPPAAHG